MNLHRRHQPRFTVQQRRQMLYWAIIAVCSALLGVVGWMIWR